jgi:hypothetical protein
MLFIRQRLLLTLLDALGQPCSATDFQKLLFLYTCEQEDPPSYDFVPYRFGCFSFTSYADKRRLIAVGLLENEENRWALTETGRTQARQHSYDARSVARFARQWSNLRGDALVAEVYRRHPYYATKSEILERVLPEAADRERVLTARPQTRGPGLVTIGYEGKALESYLNLLLRDSVTLLCDVRRNPLSRKFGFSKSALSASCAGVGIRYEHLPELGIASDQRRKLETRADYEALFDQYEKQTLPSQTAELEAIRAWIDRDGYRVALTCYEADPAMCHRRRVADALTRIAGPTLTPFHL